MMQNIAGRYSSWSLKYSNHLWKNSRMENICSSKDQLLYGAKCLFPVGSDGPGCITYAPGCSKVDPTTVLKESEYMPQVVSCSVMQRYAAGWVLTMYSR